MTRARARILALVVVVGLGAAACGDDATTTPAAPPGEEGTAPPPEEPEAPELADQCPVGAIDEVETPVEIVYWHAMNRALEDALVELTNEFNAAQDDVVVRLVNQTSYRDNLTKFRAALAGGDLPDLIQLEDTATQQIIDSQRVLPAEACVQATGYDLSDHVERVVAFYTVEGILWPVPFNVSNPVLYYNRAAFEAAGLDADDPPTTLEEVREASQAIVDAGVAPHGYALRQQAWFLEQWLAKAGEPFVNNGNGRDGRATEVLFDSDTGLAIFEWMNEMVTSGLALDAGSAEGSIDHYLAIGNENAAMTIDTSAALGTIFQVLGSGQFENVELGAAPMPGPSGEGGVLVGGAANYIVNASSAAEQEAAWRFATYLNEPDVMARWAALTGYVPVRQASIDTPTMQEAWEERPELRIAYEQLLAGVENVATAGPVVGDALGVRDVVEEGMERMITAGVAPDVALAEAAQRADRVMADYNARVGG